MSNKRKFKDLTIRDNFMFAAVMMSNDNCKKFLEILLGIAVKEIVISYEKSMIYNPECKGIRLDVYANDENNTRYDYVEMQVAEQELGKRIRYYHSQMDMDLLESGHEYKELPTAYVIFICNFDPFKKEKYCYTFENRCIENLDLDMGDESRSIVLSTEGKDANSIPKELKAFLEFVKEDTPENNTKTEDDYVRQLQKSIRSVKENRKLERSFMSLEDVQNAAKREGKIESKKESILEVLEVKGEIPKELIDDIMSESRLDVLKIMLKKAAEVTSVSDFRNEVSKL